VEEERVREEEEEKRGKSRRREGRSSRKKRIKQEALSSLPLPLVDLSDRI